MRVGRFLSRCEELSIVTGEVEKGRWCVLETETVIVFRALTALLFGVVRLGTDRGCIFFLVVEFCRSFVWTVLVIR